MRIRSKASLRDAPFRIVYRSSRIRSSASSTWRAHLSAQHSRLSTSFPHPQLFYIDSHSFDSTRPYLNAGDLQFSFSPSLGFVVPLIARSNLGYSSQQLFFSTSAPPPHLTGVVSSLTSASPTSSSSITFLMPHVVLRRDWNNLRIAITTNPWVFHVSHVPTGLSGRLLIQPQVEQAPSTYPRGTFFFVSVCLQGYRASVYFYRRT